jgi:hypothetical protein
MAGTGNPSFCVYLLCGLKMGLGSWRAKLEVQVFEKITCLLANTVLHYYGG